MSDHAERTRTIAFRNALTDLAQRDGVDTALDAAAATLAHYSANVSHGMMRQADLILLVPNDETLGGKND